MKTGKYLFGCLIIAFLLTNISFVKAQISNSDSNIKAIKTVKVVKEDNQAESLYYFNIAKAYEQEKSIDKAIANYKLAIKTNPNLGAAYSNLGLIYAEKGDYKNSIEVFKKYLNFSNNPEEEASIKEFINKISPLLK